MTFCTDKSLGMGLHINEAQEMRRWNPIFSDLDQPRQPGEYPPWFKHYKEAAEETKHGLLIFAVDRFVFTASGLDGFLLLE